MSDEERAGEKWVRHRPSYRSDLFNKFIETLDSRAGTSDRARFPRDTGSPREKQPPLTAKQWMLCRQDTEHDDGRNSSVHNISAELFTSDDSS